MGFEVLTSVGVGCFRVAGIEDGLCEAIGDVGKLIEMTIGEKTTYWS